MAAVAVDSRDQVYVFSRSAHPVTVFDRDGNFLRSWGEGVFKRAHGLSMAPDDTIFCTDDGDHSVRRCTPEGKVLLTLGTPGTPKPYMGGEPFCQCTHTALSPNGDIYVSDGYGNARVHKYSPDGRLILSWGTSGVGKGEFNLPHNVCCDEDGWVYVADRENHRVQIFDGKGSTKPSGMICTVRARCSCRRVVARIAMLASAGRPMGSAATLRILVRGSLSSAGRTARSLRGSAIGRRRIFPGRSHHRTASRLNSRGDIYVGEVAKTGWGNLFPGVTPDRPRAVLQKLVKME